MNDLTEKWVREGKASLLPLRISAEFSDYLDTMEWVGAGLEWSRMQPFATINISKASVDELVAWTKTTALGAYSHMALCTSAKAPCVLVPLEEGMRHIDERFWRTGGIHYCFGVEFRQGEPTPDFRALLQYGGGDLLYAKTRPS